MTSQGQFAEKVGHYVTNAQDTRRKGYVEFKPKPLSVPRGASEDERRDAADRRKWLERVLPQELIKRKLITKLPDGTFQDCHGQPWTYPSHQDWGSGVTTATHDSTAPTPC